MLWNDPNRAINTRHQKDLAELKQLLKEERSEDSTIYQITLSTITLSLRGVFSKRHDISGLFIVSLVHDHQEIFC